MARSFDGVDDIVNCGSGASIDAVNTFTWFAWIYPTSMGENSYGRIADKGDPKVFIMDGVNTTNGMTCQVLRATTNTYAVASINTIVLNAWQFVAVTHDDTAAQDIHLFRGTPSTDVVETGYTATQNGSGAITSDAANSWVIGSNVGTTESFAGRICHVGLYAGILTLAQLNMVKLGLLVRPDILKAYLPLFGVMSPEPDWSGNNNHGTVTGAIRIDHPPGLGLWMPSRRVQRVPVVGGANWLKQGYWWNETYGHVGGHK